MANAHHRARPARNSILSQSLRKAPPRKTIFDGTKLALVRFPARPTTNGRFHHPSLNLRHTKLIDSTRIALTAAPLSATSGTFYPSSNTTRGSSPPPASHAARHTAGTKPAPASIAHPSPHCASRFVAPDRSSIPRTSDTRPPRNCQARTRNSPPRRSPAPSHFDYLRSQTTASGEKFYGNR
jgi:hypothetical protein